MLKIVKELFFPEKDYAGRKIDEVIARLALQTNTYTTDWSYVSEYKVYENTCSGLRVYPHEISQGN